MKVIFHKISQFICNLIFPLKIKAPRGTVVGCSLWKLRRKFRGGGIISVTSGNILEFTDDFLDEKLPKFPTKIIISGENNIVKISLQTQKLHPRLEVGGKDNQVTIGKHFNPASQNLCHYWFGERNVLTFGDNVTFANYPRVPSQFNRISMGGEDCSICIGNRCWLVLNIMSIVRDGCRDWHFRCGDGTAIGGLTVSPMSPCKVTIGKDVLISWDIYIGCGSHALLDENGNCTNICQGVEIGNHVWIGRGVIIPGTAKIPSGCVVGSNAVVTKSFEEEDCVLGGVPAKVIKRGVRWVHESPTMWVNGMLYPKP